MGKFYRSTVTGFLFRYEWKVLTNDSYNWMGNMFYVYAGKMDTKSKRRKKLLPLNCLAGKNKYCRDESFGESLTIWLRIIKFWDRLLPILYDVILFSLFDWTSSYDGHKKEIKCVTRFELSRDNFEKWSLLKYSSFSPIDSILQLFLCN